MNPIRCTLRLRQVPLGLLALLVTPSLAIARETSYRVERLGDGVYAILRHVAPGGASDSNVLIVINEADVVVVDSGILPSSARDAVAEIRKLTPLPVSYLVNTHWHSDHHYGNHVYREAYPGVEIVQHPRTRELVVEDDIPSLEKNLEVEYPQVVERLKSALATGVRSNGEPVTDEQRASFEVSLELYRTFLEEMGSTPVVPGTLTVPGELTLHRGRRRIDIRFLGRGNTPGDLIVHLPDDGIVATGDLVVHPIPFAFFSHLGEWPETLRALRAIEAAIILPGHGDVMHDWDFLDSLIPLIESTWAQVQASVAAGADLDTTYAGVDVNAFREAFGGEESRQAFDRLYLRPAVEAAWAELTTGATRLE
jgi:glyoxylase-like metal-dependent hydrolase (beta-lactamase superfamily II)